jgi:hypothetical protein
MMGREQKRVKIVVDGEDIEQVQTLNIWAVRYLQ